MPTLVSDPLHFSFVDRVPPGIALGGEVVCLRRAGLFKDAPRALFVIKEFL
ncbi:hypothetical protein [Pseudomonas fluorescens]|uniref:hypothetical protein n=1 Tax=Pseudomonas fluorescens TaxID=294 RepID=UPI001300CA1D|nr:hypothetical protein [Pseudomonas fluorescens]